MTDETKATAPQSAENAPAITDPEQIRAEAERAAKEVAERKARSLDIMENYRDNQKAERKSAQNARQVPIAPVRKPPRKNA